MQLEYTGTLARPLIDFKSERHPSQGGIVTN